MATGLLRNRPRLPEEIPRGWISGVVVVGVTLTVGLTSWLMEHGSYNTSAAVFVAVGLVLISYPMMRRATALEDPQMARLLWLAFATKLVAALPRYAMAFGLYDGQTDAVSYSRAGATLARQFRAGDFTIDVGEKIQGTGFIKVLTGIVYTVTGATDLGGFLVFSWFSFWGLYLFYRAFVRACPHADHLRYARLVFFLPSLVFWPSSIGKEAWICLGLGLAAYGSARALTHARGGFLLCAAGLVAVGAVRPHVAALVALSLVPAYLLGRTRRTGSGPAPIGRLFGSVVLVGVLVLAVGQMEKFLGVDAFDRQSVEVTLTEVTRRTGQGASFTTGTHTDFSLANFPKAFVNVILRPLPWEARNAQAFISSLESVFLLGLIVHGARQLLATLWGAFTTPYVILCACYTALFVYGFSSFANYGILVRQRVQVLPFLVALLAIRQPIDAETTAQRGQVSDRLGIPAGSDHSPQVS